MKEVKVIPTSSWMLLSLATYCSICNKKFKAENSTNKICKPCTNQAKLEYEALENPDYIFDDYLNGKVIGSKLTQ